MLPEKSQASAKQPPPDVTAQTLNAAAGQHPASRVEF